MKRISFLGLGLMGAAMARRLMDHGFELTIWNRNARRADVLVEAGARLAATPADAARGAEAVIAMLADDAASRAIWLGEQGALAAMDPGTLAIDSSTLTVGCMRELGAHAATHGVSFLDAPVTGSKPQAEQGALNFLVGGDAGAVERATPLFRAMGRGQVHVGPAGSGALLKLINNFVCGVQVAALAEAMAMIERGGLDRAKALEIIANGAPGSPLVKAVSTRMTTPDYTPNFLLRLMAKDLTYAIAEGGKLSVELATAAAALETFQNGIAAGHGEKDIAAVVEQFRNGQIKK